MWCLSEDASDTEESSPLSMFNLDLIFVEIIEELYRFMPSLRPKDIKEPSPQRGQIRKFWEPMSVQPEVFNSIPLPSYSNKILQHVDEAITKAKEDHCLRPFIFLQEHDAPPAQTPVLRRISIGL